jgi:hypothetical protein
MSNKNKRDIYLQKKSCRKTRLDFKIADIVPDNQ